MEKTMFAPAININEKVITPKGYVWVLGFALAGCEWAIKEASKPDFLEVVRSDIKKEAIDRLETEIKRYELRIAKLKDEICSCT